MNTTKKDNVASQDPFFFAAVKKLLDPLRLFRAVTLLSAAELGLGATQVPARRRRIGKRKGPGDQELQRYGVGDPLVFLACANLFRTFSAGISLATNRA